MELVVRAALGFVVAAVLLGTMEALWPEDKEQPRWRADSSTDVVYWFFTLVVTKTLVGVLILIALALTMRTLPRLDTTFAAAQPAWLQALEVLLIGDFIGYWSHRWSHHAPALWRLHAIHHSPEQLDWLAATRVHPLDGVLHKVAAIVPLYLLGFAPNVLAAYAPFLALYPLLVHANVSWNFGPLRYVLATPGFHRWHHAADAEALDKNFSGLFPFFDLLFGTAYFPKDRRPQKYGLYQEHLPTGFWQQIIHPFRKD